MAKHNRPAKEPSVLPHQDKTGEPKWVLPPQRRSVPFLVITISLLAVWLTFLGWLAWYAYWKQGTP